MFLMNLILIFSLNDDSKMIQSEDSAEVIVNQLKLNPRVHVKTASFIATNPF